jgi:uncharacterized protein YhaN
MIIRRIEVRNFRKLVGPVVIDALGTGLSIIVGDNEEGKSTLLQAVRSGFFDKHNMTGERAESLQPYNSAVRPELRIVFELDGAPYTLLKAFCQRPEAELVTPVGRLTGSAAEEELEKLLRFTRPKRARKESDHEHEGLFGMFWVEQGKSFAGVDTTEDGRASIVQALQKEVGDVLGGKRGQRIMAEVARMRGQLFTATRRPRGEYAEATQKVLSIADDLRNVEQRLAEYDQNLEELERCRAKLKRHSADGSVRRAEERLQKARASQQQVEGLQRDYQGAEAAVKAASTRQELATDRWEERQKAIATVEAGRRKVAQYKETLGQRREVLTPIRERVARGEKATAEAAERFEEADRDFIAASAAEQVARLQSELQRLQREERAALEAKSAQEKALLAAKGIAIEKKHVAQLKRLEEAVGKAQAQLDAVATNVCIKLEPGTKARFGNSTISAQTERRITETTVIHIAKSAEITIIPGGDLGNPRTELERHTQTLRQSLAKFGVGSTPEAEAKAEERTRHLAEAEKHAELVHAHAPDGIEALHEKIRELQAEVARLIEVAGKLPKSVKEATDALDRVRQERDEADRNLKGSRRRLDQATQELNESQQQEATCKASYETEQGHLQAAEGLLQAGREKAADADLQQVVMRVARDVKTAELTAQAAHKALDAADSENVARELCMAEEALKQVQGDIRKLEEKCIRLETELRTTGATGLGERKQELQAELDGAHAVAARFEHQAKTVELLYSVLTEAEKTARETFLRPVAERVQPYLKLLLPGTELKLNEEMNIVGLQRGAVEEKFESLSLGTREQLAVLTRLAFADLMREHGQPATVLLDDAIVFADDQRFDRMLHILQKAAQHLQIIVLTCREREYQAAGAPIIRLSDCYSPKASHTTA